MITEADLKEQVEGSLNMSATYETVVTRAQLALVSIARPLFTFQSSTHGYLLRVHVMYSLLMRNLFMSETVCGLLCVYYTVGLMPAAIWIILY